MTDLSGRMTRSDTNHASKIEDVRSSLEKCKLERGLKEMHDAYSLHYTAQWSRVFAGRNCIFDISANSYGDTIFQPDLHLYFDDSKIPIDHDIHSISYFNEFKGDKVPNLTYVTHPGHKRLVKELLQKITFNDTATKVLDVANNYSSIMLEDKDKYFEIRNNNIVCMECMNSGDSFSVALDYIAQWCSGSFGDDGGASIYVMKRILLADDAHFGEGMGDSTFATDSVQNLVAGIMVYHDLSFVVDHKLGEGVVDFFNECVV